ncbi:MAG: hypothetical protein AAB588_04405 [Patescibacteria group bacterium]
MPLPGESQNSPKRPAGEVIRSIVDTFRKIGVKSPEAAKNADRMVDGSGTINYNEKE